MGGRGSGGARVGAGRKPKSAREKVLGGHAGKRSTRASKARDRKQKPNAGPPAIPVPAPPVGLSPSERKIWEHLAPLAAAEQTLVPSTAESFRELVEAIQMRRAMLRQLGNDGMTVIDAKGNVKAHPLMTHQRAMLQRIEAGRARFKLAPFGKALDSAAGWRGSDEKPDDEWSDFDEEEATIQ